MAAPEERQSLLCCCVVRKSRPFGHLQSLVQNCNSHFLNGRLWDVNNSCFFFSWELFSADSGSARRLGFCSWRRALVMSTEISLCGLPSGPVWGDKSPTPCSAASLLGRRTGWTLRVTVVLPCGSDCRPRLPTVVSTAVEEDRAGGASSPGTASLLGRARARLTEAPTRLQHWPWGTVGWGRGLEGGAGSWQPQSSEQQWGLKAS